MHWNYPVRTKEEGRNNIFKNKYKNGKNMISSHLPKAETFSIECMFKECNSAPSSGVVNQIFLLLWWVLYPKTQNPGKGEPNYIGSRTHQYSLICVAKNPQNLRENPTFLVPESRKLNSTWTHHYFWVFYNLSTLFLQQIEFAWNLIVKNRYILHTHWSCLKVHSELSGK